MTFETGSQAVHMEVMFGRPGTRTSRPYRHVGKGLTSQASFPGTPCRGFIFFPDCYNIRWVQKILFPVQPLFWKHQKTGRGRLEACGLRMFFLNCLLQE